MPPASADEQELSKIKNEIDEMEHWTEHAIAQGDHTLHELREIKERLTKLEEQVAALKRCHFLRDLGA